MTAEIYKDKIEVSLDGRQIFYLFFGGAVIVGLVFVLGVMIGRRVEARGHVDRTHTDATEDPLAALDRLEAGGPGVAKQLLAPAPATPAVEPVERKIEQERPQASGLRPQADAEKTAKAADDHAKAEKAAAAEKAAEKEKADKADRAAEKEKADKAEKAEKAEKAAEKEKAAKAADKPAEAKPEGKVRYTLQLSSFQDRGEAQSFVDDLKAAGFEPTMTEADGRGQGDVLPGAAGQLQDARRRQ